MTNKYRIFDKKHNEYVEEPDYRWMLSRNGKLYNSENDEWYNIGERYIVEFSTGIFDKNKTEIFEGDKFPDDFDDDEYLLIEFDSNLCKFCVNAYGYPISENENGGEEFDNEISLLDRDFCNVEDVQDLAVSGNINLK